jgi:hypothetical protein
MSADANKEKVVEEILRLQQARTEAMLAKDEPALQKFLDDDLIHIHSSGRIDTKASFIDNLMKGKTGYKKISYNNVKVGIYGDSAIISGNAVIETIQSNLDLIFTTVWVKSGGNWRSISWHTTKRAA